MTIIFEILDKQENGTHIIAQQLFYCDYLIIIAAATDTKIVTKEHRCLITPQWMSFEDPESHHCKQ